jgi:SAM-dependent methyltransferase
MQEFDRKTLASCFGRYVRKSARILDVGCGIGENMLLLKGMGYQNIVGVDISPEMVKKATAAGCECYLDTEMGETGFDVILFSHVIEHLGYPGIVSFLESYFARASEEAMIVVLTPTLYEGFFADIDHIKPYYPEGLLLLFSDRNASRQYHSRFRLELVDIRFRRDSLIPYNLRSRYIRTLPNRFLFFFIARFFLILKAITFNMLSRTTGYIAVFRLKTDKQTCSA